MVPRSKKRNSLSKLYGDYYSVTVKLRSSAKTITMYLKFSHAKPWLDQRKKTIRDVSLGNWKLRLKEPNLDIYFQVLKEVKGKSENHNPAGCC